MEIIIDFLSQTDVSPEMEKAERKIKLGLEALRLNSLKTTFSNQPEHLQLHSSTFAPSLSPFLSFAITLY